jgi:glycosyltransferase involved in cell wall biosynthesis
MGKEDNIPVLVLPSDAGGCGAYRMRWPGEACAAAGLPVLVQNRMPRIAVDHAGKVEGINVGNYRVVVMQRPGSYQLPQVIRILQENGVKVCIDMDDSMSKIDPRNPVYKKYDPKVNQKRNWDNVAISCSMADLVICTTEALAEEYGSHGRVTIIKNHIPRRYLDIPRKENDSPIVTWAGWTLTHPGDLNITSGAISSALAGTNGRFMAFGDLDIFSQLQVRYRSPNFHRGFEEITRYPEVLVQADIGIVPLKKSPFNECKSWLKVLEYASLGIVPVASPNPDNIQFAELGGCILAEKPADWEREVRELISDNEKRAELSKKVREVASRFVLEDNHRLWYDAWIGKVV